MNCVRNKARECSLVAQLYHSRCLSQFRSPVSVTARAQGARESLLKTQESSHRLKLAAMSSSSTIDIAHKPEDKIFSVYFKEGDESSKAFLQYAWVKPDTADLFETYVPNQFRGKGVAKLLAQEALEYFAKEDKKMILSCSYLQKYVKDNPSPHIVEKVVES